MVSCECGTWLSPYTKSSNTLILDFSALRLWEINTYCLSHPICGTFCYNSQTKIDLPCFRSSLLRDVLFVTYLFLTVNKVMWIVYFMNVMYYIHSFILLCWITQISGKNSTWSLCIIMLICSQILVARILLMIFISIALEIISM